MRSEAAQPTLYFPAQLGRASLKRGLPALGIGAPQHFPAQLGRASLKPGRAGPDIEVADHFPAQLGRASLKRVLLLAVDVAGVPISRPNWAGPH